MGAPPVPVAVVTGANTGIGFETAVGLAGRGYRVVLAARSESRGDAAVAAAAATSGSDAVEPGLLDLASFDSVHEFARVFLARHDRLDVLVHNAGVLMSSRHETVDGCETALQVNHLGPFLLDALLRPHVVATAGSRVVVVSSEAHRSTGGLDLSDLQTRRRRYRGFQVYARTKLANVLFTRELARRLAPTGTTANALHPGLVCTRLARDGDGGVLGALAMPLLRPFVLSPRQGAQTSIHLATAAEVDGVSGLYWTKCLPAEPSRAARDDATAAALWDASAALTGLG